MEHLRENQRGSQRKRMGPASNLRGMTLVETLMAFLIFIIAGSGVVGSYLFTSQLSESAMSTMEATTHLQDMLERIRATPFNNILTRFPNGTPNGGGSGADDYASIVGGYTLNNEQITVTYPSQATGRLEILVTVTWTQGLRQRSTRLSAMRTG